MNVMARVVVILALVGPVACATNPPPATTPILSPTLTADISLALQAVQAAAISLAPIDGIPAADTAVIVQFVSTALPIVQAAQTGWVTTVDLALSSTEALLSPSAATTLDPWLNAVQAAITALYSAPPNGQT
jgi:hypothetical protein